MKSPSIKEVFLIILFLIPSVKISALLESPVASDSYFFLAYGCLLKIDPEEQNLSLLCTFHQAASIAARSPNGLFWARMGEKFLAAFNPLKGKIEEKVELPHRPYNHIITPNGKAYVTHHTLTPQGFLVSVVDTSEKKLKKTIKNIYGLRTGLTYGNGFVYLATIGVGRPDNLYLYQINTQNDKLKEIYRIPKTDYHWKISVFGNELYLCHINMPNKSLAPMIEIMNLEKKKITRTINAANLKGIKEIIGKITFVKDKAFLPCRTPYGGYGIALLNPHSGSVERILDVISHIYRIIGIKDDTLFYIDSPASAGKNGISLYFYNLRERKEVKIISITQFLKRE